MKNEDTWAQRIDAVVGGLWNKCGALGYSYRDALIGAFGGVSFGRPEKLCDGDWPWGTSLRWEGKPPCSTHEYITHHMHWVTAGLTSKKINCNAVLTTSGQQDLDEYFFCEKHSVQHCGIALNLGQWCHKLTKIHLFSSYLIKAAVLLLESCKEKKEKENQTPSVLTSFEEWAK